MVTSIQKDSLKKKIQRVAKKYPENLQFKEQDYIIRVKLQMFMKVLLLFSTEGKQCQLLVSVP